MIEKAIRLLQESANKFRFYEQAHRAKDTVESLGKAEVNREMAEKIEDFIQEYNHNIDNERFYS